MSDALARAADAAREFEQVHDGIALRLRIPTRLAMRRLVAGAGSPAAAQEPVLQAAVVGWSHVPSREIVPGTEGDLPFSPALVPHVLDRYPVLADNAFLALMESFAKRQDTAETAAGN